MRVRQKHVITVVMDTTYNIIFGQLDVQHGYSISKSARIAEIEVAGTGAFRHLSALNYVPTRAVFEAAEIGRDRPQRLHQCKSLFNGRAFNTSKVGIR
jgi:hypothetical protein